MKEKYADQDDDEREMRLALIGAKGVQNFDTNLLSSKTKFSDPNDSKYRDGMLPEAESDGEDEDDEDQAEVEDVEGAEGDAENNGGGDNN